MSVKKEDLNPNQRKTFDMWRTIGLSEQAALDAMVEDGVIRLSDEEKVARTLRGIFPTLTESQSLAAACGRDGGPASRPVAELSGLMPDPANIKDVIRKIEEVASDLCRRGVPEEKALRESAFELMRLMPNEQLADWVVRIAAFRWPQLYPSSGSSGSKSQTRTVGETTRPRSSRRMTGD